MISHEQTPREPSDNDDLMNIQEQAFQRHLRRMVEHSKRAEPAVDAQYHNCVIKVDSIIGDTQDPEAVVLVCCLRWDGGGEKIPFSINLFPVEHREDLLKIEFFVCDMTLGGLSSAELHIRNVRLPDRKKKD